MDTTPQPPPPSLLRVKFDNVSLLFLILTLLAVMVVSSKLALPDDVRSWLMQIITTAVGAFIGLAQGSGRIPLAGQAPSTAKVDINPGEKAIVSNITPPATTTKV